VILAQTAATQSTSWVSVTTGIVFGLSAMAVSWLGVWRSWKQAQSSKSSAATATKQAEAANQAREATAASLGRILGVWGEYVELEKKRLGVDYRVYLHLDDKKAYSCLGIRIFNASPERTIAVKAIGVGNGPTANGQTALVLVAPPRSAEDWSVEQDRERTIFMGAGTVARMVTSMPLQTMNSVWILFEHSEEPYIVTNDDVVRAFLELCRALAQWREANPRRYDAAHDTWNYDGFEPFGPKFRLKMDD
jgi:hypothetical protein